QRRQAEEHKKSRQLDRARRQAEDRLASALSRGRADDLGRALEDLAEAVSLCKGQPALAPLGDRAEGYRRRLEQLQRFRQLAGAGLRQATEGGAADKGADVFARRCEEALDVYGPPDKAAWAAADGPLSPEQAAEVKQTVTDLLTMLVLREAAQQAGEEA